MRCSISACNRSAGEIARRWWRAGVLVVTLSGNARFVLAQHPFANTSTNTLANTSAHTLANTNVEPAVISVPFELGMQGHIFVQAEVSGHRGTFVLDTGWPGIGLNPEYLRRAVHGVGYDTVTAASRDSAAADMMRNPYGDTAEVIVRFGTLTIHVNRQNGQPASGLPTVSHLFGVERGQELEAGLQRPLLGLLGPSVFAQFETVIDYVHLRLTFIPVDSAGRRVAAVPAYVPAVVVPMLRHNNQARSDIRDKWSIEGQVGATRLVLHLDAGAANNYLTDATEDRLATHLQDAGHDPILGHQRQLDTLVVAGHAYPGVKFGLSQFGIDGLGSPFFQHCGAVGFNFRARQFLIYQQQSHEQSHEH